MGLWINFGWRLIHTSLELRIFILALRKAMPESLKEGTPESGRSWFSSRISSLPLVSGCFYCSPSKLSFNFLIISYSSQKCCTLGLSFWSFCSLVVCSNILPSGRHYVSDLLVAKVNLQISLGSQCLHL